MELANFTEKENNLINAIISKAVNWVVNMLYKNGLELASI